ncbi:MAG: thiamine-phosphate kinase [Planctomycetaceae bacterium]|nr:thiamine-phosphate kinase [Planctomycetaceae bacterium]
MRELDFIEWIYGRSRFDSGVVPVGPGDDCAVVKIGGHDVLITVDQVLDGVHFMLDRDGPMAAGRKAMARNLSDIAAMAGVPTAAVASVALPRGMSELDCQAIYAGLREAGDAFNCPLVGGDVGSWADKMAISVTIIGRPGPHGAVLRSGARAGDAICVTGSLGGSWRGEKHLTFTPRIAEGLDIARRCDLHAMIDISDGLAADLHHICKASHFGAEIMAADMPVASDSTLDGALSDGEDYELLFTLPAGQAAALVAQGAAGTSATRVGTITMAPEVVLIAPDGGRTLLQPKGWQHST